MLDWLFGSKQSKTDNLPPYEEARDIADKGSLEKRQWLASRKGLQPEFLYFFASDKEHSVRQAVAANESTPLQADKILSKDQNESVRLELARKISRLLPGIDTSRADKVTEMVLEIVRVLAEDKAARVRAIVSDEIKTLKNVPQDLVEQLAWDAESIVSMPVLEYSPLLSDRHLLEIIRSGIDGGALAAIARRTKLSQKVSGAVSEEKVDTATIDLLKNTTASISQKSFNLIADTAQKSTSILDNLIDREDITMATIRRVASFVGNAVLSRILERHGHRADIDKKEMRDIRHKVSDRIMKGGADEVAIPGEEARKKAEKLYESDNLDEAVLLKAIEDGERMFVIHSLALLSGFGWKSVRDILNSKTAKNIASLSWKSGLLAENSVVIQSKFCSISRLDLVKPDNDGGYPFTEDDMEWNLNFFE